jgi:hypothetical protein
MTTPCVAAERCREYDHRASRPAPSDAPLCQACLRAAGREVHNLIYDYVDLEQAIPAVRQPGQPLSGTRDAPVPLALHVEALQRAIWHTVVTWEDVLRDHDRLGGARVRVRPGWAVQRGVEIIGPRIVLLAGLPPVAVWPEGPDGPPADLAGAEGLLIMMRLHASSRAVLGLTRLIHELPGECSGCQLAALRREDGSETVYCASCYARWTWDEYRQYTRLATKGMIKQRRRRRRARLPRW